MKTILVTGAAGYIGRHVVKNALDRGYKVIAADFNFKGVDERAEFCDVPLFSGDADLYRKLGSPDICIHLAWRDGFRHNSPAHMKDLSSHIVFLNALIDGGLKDLSIMGTMHEVGYRACGTSLPSGRTACCMIGPSRRNRPLHHFCSW